jgi:hypothetical protein
MMTQVPDAESVDPAGNRRPSCDSSVCPVPHDMVCLGWPKTHPARALRKENASQAIVIRSVREGIAPKGENHVSTLPDQFTCR